MRRTRIGPPSTFGVNVKREREARGLSQRELAGMAGVVQSAISEVELGRVVTPNVTTVYALAVALGMRMEDLMGSPRVETTTKYRSAARAKAKNARDAHPFYTGGD